MGLSGDWTYEKSWQEPESINIDFEVLIDKNDPSKGTKQETAVFTDQQWSETWSQYATFAHQNPDNTYDTQDYVIYRLRRTYTTAAAVCPNLFKGLLEAGKKVTNTDVYRDEETNYVYIKTDDGWAAESETTSGFISGYEYAGALPLVDFRPFLGVGTLNSNLDETILATTTTKEFQSTNVARKLSNATVSAKRIYSKTTTLTRSAFALTQEGQHYLQALLKQETGGDTESGAAWLVPLSAWNEGEKMQADGTQVNSTLGRLALERKPNEYDEAEEDLSEDDALDEGAGTNGDDGDTADTSTGGDDDDGQSDSSDGRKGTTSDNTGNRVDLIGTDLTKLWESWSPYGDSGTGIVDNNKVWDGDPASGSDNKPLYTMKVGGGGVADRGEIRVNTSDPKRVRQIKISPISEDGFATNPFETGERIFLNSATGAYSWWYRIRAVSKNGRAAEVKYIDDILRPTYQDILYGGQNLTAGWSYRALVTGVSDSSDRVFEMPYAPDDFLICLDGDFHVVPADQQQAAARYAYVQKRPHEG